MANFKAELFVSLAWRKALAEYIQSNLRWGKASDSKSLTVYWTPLDGQDDAQYPCAMIRPSMANAGDHSTVPTPLESTRELVGDRWLMLCKDADHEEETVLRIKGNNEVELSKIALYLWPLMNPKANKFGIYLDLGDLYYGQRCQISITSSGYVGLDQSSRKQGIHMMDFTISVKCPVVKIVNGETFSGDIVVDVQTEEKE